MTAMHPVPQVYALADGEGTQLTLSSRGATWLSCRVPLDGGSTRQVMLGHASAADHGVQPGYLGSVVGRWGNRIGGARFSLDGREHLLAANEGGHLLHGGAVGFDKRDWQLLEHSQRSLRLALVSEDGDQGFPGRLQAEVAYTIVAPGHIVLSFSALCDAATPVNLTSHAYFNLDGSQPQALPIDQHHFRIAASRVLAVDEALIPLGPLLAVQGTAFDLRLPQALAQREFDHCFVFDEPAASTPQLQVVSGDGRLQLAISSDYPGVQFYTGQWLARGHDHEGRPFLPRAGFALEPQYFPDSPRHADKPAWRQPAPDGTEPGWLLRPGRRYSQHIHYRFGAPN